MSWLARFTNLFRQRRLRDELDEELASHIDEAVARGRSAEEARRAFGSALQYREQSRDLKLLPWLEAVAADAVFGWRQLNKRHAASLSAILSLALAIGSSTAIFRLVDAVLLRILPVAEPQRLSYLTISLLDREGRPDYRDDFDYPTFRKYRDLLADRADLMVVGIASRQDCVIPPVDQPERIRRQFVSGNLFGVFGLQPTLGRLLTPQDDVTPGGQPVAVLSYDFWTRRFGRDPNVGGRTFRLGNQRFEIVGVGPKGFIGTEPGELTDVFVPAMMNAEAIDKPGWSWFRIWLRPKAGWPGGAGAATARGGISARPGGARPEIRQRHSAAGDRAAHAPEAAAPAGRRWSFGSAQAIPAAAKDPRGSGGAGVADRVRQRRQSAERPGRRPGPGDGVARIDRRWPMAAHPTGADGKRAAGRIRLGPGRGVRLVVGAAGGIHAAHAGGSGTPGAPDGLARIGIRSGADDVCHAALRSGSRAPGLRGQAGERA
jgi:hypothetical protein